ncbi:hypothetical protein EDM02_03550 [Candidatus Cardinium hertigii]|uniref:Uncharacterized protein n=1 Tax=Candidatus Cardinium hertigii TaxID=247481 RepID=A0A3N2QBK0_9BACT|nr:hypothetical protein EDM02_03550 [Candidatus Cardinium hertigii]
MSRYTFRYLFKLFFFKLFYFFITFIWHAGQSPAQAQAKKKNTPAKSNQKSLQKKATTSSLETSECSIDDQHIAHVHAIFERMEEMQDKPGCSSSADLDDGIRFITMICNSRANANSKTKFHNNFIKTIRENQDGIAVLAYLLKDKKSSLRTFFQSTLHRSGTKSAANLLALAKELYTIQWNTSNSLNKTNSITFVKTNKLKALENNQDTINLKNISSILDSSCTQAVHQFKALFKLFFEENATGNYRVSAILQAFLENEVEFKRISSILSGSGKSAAKAFEELFAELFEWKNGAYVPTAKLKAFKARHIELVNISTILSGSGRSAAESFQELFDTLFEKGNGEENGAYVPTAKLKTFTEQKHKVELINICSILHGSGRSAAKAFQELFNALFEKKNEAYVPGKRLKAFNEHGCQISVGL